MSENNSETTLTERATISRRITELKPNAVLDLANLGLTVEVHSSEWPKLAADQNGEEYALGVSDGRPYARSLESGERETLTRLTVISEGADTDHERANADHGPDQVAPDGGDREDHRTVNELGQDVMTALADADVDTGEVSAYPMNGDLRLEYGDRAIATDLETALADAGFQFDHSEDFRRVTITDRVMTDGGVRENTNQDPRDLFNPQPVESDLAVKVKFELAESGIHASEFFIQELGDVVAVQFANREVLDALQESEFTFTVNSARERARVTGRDGTAVVSFAGPVTRGVPDV